VEPGDQLLCRSTKRYITAKNHQLHPIALQNRHKNSRKTRCGSRGSLDAASFGASSSASWIRRRKSNTACSLAVIAWSDRRVRLPIVAIAPSAIPRTRRKSGGERSFVSVRSSGARASAEGRRCSGAPKSVPIRRQGDVIVWGYELLRTPSRNGVLTLSSWRPLGSRVEEQHGHRRTRQRRRELRERARRRPASSAGSRLAELCDDVER
jgi:hypothetical protein